MLEIRTSPAHSVVQSTSHWTTEHVGFVNRLYMFYMKTVSVRMYTFITVKITSKFRMTVRLSGTDLALKPLLCSKVPVISRLLKYNLCPPPFVSRVLLSWHLVNRYLYESTRLWRLDVHLFKSLETTTGLQNSAYHNDDLS